MASPPARATARTRLQSPARVREDPSVAEIRPRPRAGSALPSAVAQLMREKRQLSAPNLGCTHPGTGWWHMWPQPTPALSLPPPSQPSPFL